jgi:hypothetical protein
MVVAIQIAPGRKLSNIEPVTELSQIMNLVCLQSTIVSYLHCPGSGVFLIKNYKRYLHIYGIALTPMGRALLLLKSKSDANISVRDLQPGIVCNIHEPTQPSLVCKIL